MFDELTLGDNVSGEDSVIDLDALMRVVTDFARLLVNEYHVSDALHDLVDGVTEVLGLTGAGVSLADGEWIRFATAGSEPIGVLERAQEEAQDGPCVVAHREGREVLVTDLADDPARWPHLSKTAARLGVAAVAGIPMRLDETRLGTSISIVPLGTTGSARRCE